MLNLLIALWLLLLLSYGAEPHWQAHPRYRLDSVRVRLTRRAIIRIEVCRIV